MGIKEILKNKVINKIKAKGYDDAQASAIKEAINFYPRLIDFVDPSYSVSQINDVLEFFKLEDGSSIAYIFNLEPVKRILMVQAYNKFASLNPNGGNRTFKLIYDIACEYNEAILKRVIEKAIADSPDYAFLNTVRTAMEENKSLYDLELFEDLKKETKTK